jgi:ABC-type multidrug transport system fused ATPase/permease subunit
MIERYYNPASGSVTVDGVPIADLNLRAFRQSVGYVG